MRGAHFAIHFVRLTKKYAAFAVRARRSAQVNRATAPLIPRKSATPLPMHVCAPTMFCALPSASIPLLIAVNGRITTDIDMSPIEQQRLNKSRRLFCVLFIFNWLRLFFALSLGQISNHKMILRKTNLRSVNSV
jgi:hypothetical protein